MKRGTCRLCGLERDLIKAHIIPESFYRSLYREDDRYLVQYCGQGEEFHCTSKIGGFDDSILCQKCDGILNDKFDKYAFDNLINEKMVPVQLKNIGPWTLCHVFGVDGIRLKKFALSVIWRASISDQPWTSKVKLNKYEDSIMGQMLSQGDVALDDFPTCFERWINNYDLIVPPFRCKFANRNAISMVLPGWRISVIVDGRGIDLKFKDWFISGKDPFVVLALEVKKSYPKNIWDWAENVDKDHDRMVLIKKKRIINQYLQMNAPNFRK